MNCGTATPGAYGMDEQPQGFAAIAKMMQAQKRPKMQPPVNAVAGAAPDMPAIDTYPVPKMPVKKFPLG